MLKNKFDPAKRYTYIRYGRMSTEQQNPRSPEQQFSTIEETLQRLGYPWQKLQDYRDDGVSGRLVRARLGFMRMLEDIKFKRIAPDLILVDTWERFGRAEELLEIRRRLATRDGVLVLTADSNFADPSSVSGKVLSWAESFRSTEENRIKAHNVSRGKRDAARQGKWPGGNAPFGYMLQSQFKDVRGRQELDYSRLVPNPKTDWIIRLLFAQAKATGWGMSRLAKFLNDHPEIPANLKPFQASSVGLWIKQRIYIGILEWEKVNTGIVDDRRVYEVNPVQDRVVVENFCEALVSLADWNAVQAQRIERAAARISSRSSSPSDGIVGKQRARGLVLKYPLTGLVRCGICGRALTPSSSKPFVAKSGEVRRYVGYVCPAVAGGGCTNKVRVPEHWLRTTVFNTLLDHLQLPLNGDDGMLAVSAILHEVMTPVRRELERLADSRPALSSALAAEADELEQQIAGWSQSLGRRDLPPSVRRDIEDRAGGANDRLARIRQQLLDEQQWQQRQQLEVDEEQVLDRLRRLHETLSGDNATAANLQLSLHIDAIRCFPDDEIVMRTCKIAILPGASELVARVALVPAEVTAAGNCRRRGRLAQTGGADQLDDDGDAVHFAMDPDRFAGLPDDYFWERRFQIPARLSWAEQNADAVYERRRLSGMTFQKLADEFGKSIPTIRQALNIGIARHKA